MSYIQYFGSILAPPLTEEEREPFKQLHQQVCLAIAEANGRVLLGGVLIVPTNFEAVLAYLVQLGKDPHVLAVTNPDGSDYLVTPDETEEAPNSTAQPLFVRDMDAYEAFFQPYVRTDGDGNEITIIPPQMGFGGWELPSRDTGVPT